MAFDNPTLSDRDAVLDRLRRVRNNTVALTTPLSAEDMMLQSMPEASPVKWNIAHTSWFYETFILRAECSGYESFHPEFGYLFNSYYNKVGKMHPRGDRGLLSRPSVDEVYSYRAYVDAALFSTVENLSDADFLRLAPLIALGVAHEEQHQELLLTDLKHCLYQNPMAPAVYDDVSAQGEVFAPDIRWREMPGGLCEIGWDGQGFAFDNEGPRHKVFLHPFEMANRPITNGEYLEFMKDGAYADPSCWLADAWEIICKEQWRAPLYWRENNGEWFEYTLFGERPVNLHAPACHISFYEADAYANWAGARLPTEIEWEAAASLFPLEGRFLKNGAPGSPAPAGDDDGDALLQLFGDVWEWTASPYVAYPGYSPPAGAIGEYNGKFMSGQMVLRGGSCASPIGHLRLSYRNFFAPNARWQYSGFRLARDCEK